MAGGDLAHAHDYDIVLSFAGEDRPYVHSVASALQEAGVRVFYDLFEEANLWGKDLYEHLDYVYGEAGRYCVLFVSKSYARKAWPTHERRSAQARALAQHEEYLLPARFDDTTVPGLRSTTAYVDLRGCTPEELARLIKVKLGGTGSGLPPAAKEGGGVVATGNRGVGEPVLDPQLTSGSVDAYVRFTSADSVERFVRNSIRRIGDQSAPHDVAFTAVRVSDPLGGRVVPTWGFEAAYQGDVLMVETVRQRLPSVLSG